MSTIITYDLSGKWNEVKQAALHNGFVDYIYSDGGDIFYLPNTTLLSAFDDPETARNIFRRIIRSVDPNLHSNIFVVQAYGAAMFDNLHKSRYALI